MAETISLKLEGMKGLVNSLNAMPSVMRTRIIVPVLTKAARTLQQHIASKIPVQQFTGRKGRHKKGKMHYRAAMTSVVREYKNTGNVIAVVGAESRQAPHAHLVESGTNQRFTNSKTKYRRTAVGTRMIIKNGKPKIVTEKQKKSLGSFIKKKGEPRLNRGRMPAIKPVKRGVDAARGDVTTEIANGIRSGITRELTEASLKRG